MANPGRIGQANEPTSPSPIRQESANAAAAAPRGLRITIDRPAFSEGGGETGWSLIVGFGGRFAQNRGRTGLCAWPPDTRPDRPDE